MPGKRKLLFVLCAFLLVMCRGNVAPASTIEGLSCRTYPDYFECTYICPDGTNAGPFRFEIDPAISATEGDLDRLFCGIAPATFTPREPTAATSPTPDASSTATETPTLSVSPTAKMSVTVESLQTAEPLLTGGVTMCDIGGNLISFRMVQPSPDLTGKTITAEIAGQETTCYVNPTNTSLMTCTLPADVTFPVTVVISLEGTVVNDFTYSGTGCVRLTTPVATTTP